MKHRIALSLLLAAALSAVPSHAEEMRLPQLSPAAKVVQAIGVTDVEIAYHRPGVKGRVIWGGLEPWGKVWRMGANEATTLSFTHALKIEGRDVPAGKYALFAIPGRDKWTVILNHDHGQWGAFLYKESEDVLRFDVKPQSGSHTEWLTFNIVPDSRTSAVVEMAWEKVRIPFKVEVGVDRIVWTTVDAVLAAKPEAYDLMQASNYALESNTRIAEAAAWIDKALAQQEEVWAYELKARLLQRQGKIDQGLESLDKAIALARKQGFGQAFVDGLEKLKKEWKAV
jgi:hypothetical protein